MISIVLDEHGHRSLQVTDSLVMGRIVAALLQRAYEAHMEETRVNLKMVAMYLVFTMVYYGLLHGFSLDSGFSLALLMWDFPITSTGESLWGICS